MPELPKVTAQFIIEMLGAPKEHLEKTLKDYVDSLRKEKDIRLIKDEMSPIEPTDKLFSGFVDLTIEFKTPDKLIDFCFESMPSSVEILEPTTLQLDAHAFSNLLNDLQARLHTVDMSMKQLSARTVVVDRNATNTLLNFLLHLCREGPKTPEQMAKVVGVKAEHITAFCDNLVAEGKLAHNGGSYSVP